MKLSKNGSSFQIILPVSIVRAKGWADKTNLELKCEIGSKGELILKEK